jgi:hypothetical protein
MYPDQSLYPANSVQPSCAASTRRWRADQIRLARAGDTYWFALIVADAGPAGGR